MSSPQTGGHRGGRGGLPLFFVLPFCPLRGRGHGEGSSCRVTRLSPIEVRPFGWKERQGVSSYLRDRGLHLRVCPSVPRAQRGECVLPSDSGSALPVEALTSDVRKASPGSAALPKRPGPEAPTRVSRPSPSKSASRPGSSPRSEAQLAFSAKPNSGGDGHHTRRERSSSVPLERRV